MSKVNWLDDWEQALAQARRANGLILMDFFNPECIGCQTMEAETYPQPEVYHFLNQDPPVVPLRVPHQGQPLAQRFMSQWTPYLVVVDTEERVHRRSLGFLPPTELQAWILMAVAQAYTDTGDWRHALKTAQRISYEYPQSWVAPEAVYLEGVAGYHVDGDPQLLKQAHHRLRQDYPQSAWVVRTKPYDKL